MLALMVHSMASLTKYYSEIIENVSEGPLDAVRSTGANKIQLVWYAVVPQIVLPYIAMTLYLWDTNVRMATVIGLVGGGGIGTLLIQYQGQAMWPEVGCIILVIAVIVWIMDLASAYIREALK
jgi:phosphonate transport system permease protein